MSATITELLELFGVVTVMDIHIYKLSNEKNETTQKFTYRYGTQPISKEAFQDTGLCLDTLKISNIKQSAAKKQFPAGLFNVIQIQTGKKVEIEIQDALGRRDTLNYFFGLDNNADKTSYAIGSNFGSLLCLEGKTWIVDMNGNKQMLWITIPCFLPKGALNLNLQADGEAGVFDLGGEAYPVVGNNNKLQYVIIGTSPIIGEVE